MLSINSELVSIRSPINSDSYLLNEVICNSYEYLLPWLYWLTPQPDLLSCRKFIDNSIKNLLQNKEFVFFIFDNLDNNFVGCSSLIVQNWDLRIFELGYWGSSLKKKKGLMSHGVQLIVDYAFKILYANRVFATTDQKNTESIKLLQRINFIYEGCLHNDRLTPDKKRFRNTVVYAKWIIK